MEQLLNDLTSPVDHQADALATRSTEAGLQSR
jgi:hypothetical protein